MKRIFFSAALMTAVLVLAQCSSTKKAAAPPPPKKSFDTDMKAVIVSNCTPCHVPTAGGRKKPYDNYVNLKTDIDEIIAAISKQPTERGFMPMRGTRLSDSLINVFVQWKKDGLLEK